MATVLIARVESGMADVEEDETEDAVAKQDGKRANKEDGNKEKKEEEREDSFLILF